jgi:hypothetical protein
VPTPTPIFSGRCAAAGELRVVTSLEFQLHPLREPLGGLIVFPFQMSKTVLQRFRDLSLEASDT